MTLAICANVAILFDEPAAARLAATIGKAADGGAVPAAALVEATPVADARTRPGMRERPDTRPDAIAPEALPVNSARAAGARESRHRSGKGRHPPRPGLGDCLAHPRAQAGGEAPLSKGGHFVLTDMQAAA